MKINENNPKVKQTTITKQAKLPKTGDNKQNNILFGVIGTCFVLLGAFALTKKTS
ncbi:LPXTG cell wall anchor domain-containing protein [Listeria welshimeri]|uniref:LPXTG cell wall anchor domain-containing protein n=1 Tax=Listeria welshimeri TaxID=1643 RepID=UPI0039840115